MKRKYLNNLFAGVHNFKAITVRSHNEQEDEINSN